MTMKTVLIVCAILFQILSVASIAVSRENILATGKQVILQTAPVDPRDIFKGDYVALDYTFSSIAYHQLEDSIKQQGLKKGQKIYLSMDIASNGTAQPKQLLQQPPAGSFYLSGYVKSHWPYRKYSKINKDNRSTSHPVAVKFGIEKYFVEQGQGLIMEKIRGERDSFQVPMLMKIAVSDKGEAVIHSFDWARISMKTEVIREAQRDAQEDESSAVIRFTIKNNSEKTMTLPLKENGCSFNLIPVLRNPQIAENYSFDRPECTAVDTIEEILHPDKTITVEIDLNQPQWRVSYENKPTPLGRLPWEYRYRIIYTGDRIEGSDVKILSSAFHGRGNID